MAVKIKPVGVIIANFGLEPNGRVQKFFQMTCYKHMDKYVPKDIGNLRENVDLSDPTRIIYQSPYAEAQYYGVINGKTISADHYTTAGTGPYWDRKMWSNEKDIVIKEVQDYIGRQ